MTDETRANVLKHLRAPEGYGAKYDPKTWQERLAFDIDSMGCDWHSWFSDWVAVNVMGDAIENLCNRAEAAERRVAELRRAALWFAENAPGTPVPQWVDEAMAAG